MNKKMIENEIKAITETIEKLEKIKVNTEIGLEANKFVLKKFEEELCTCTS
jgi:hypothetical protein